MTEAAVKPAKDRSPRGFALNAIANWTAFLYVAAVGFLLSPFIVDHLGATGYGIWSMLVAVVGYLGLLDFGVRGAVTKYIAHHHAVEDAAASSAIASAAMVLFSLLAGAAVVLAAALAYFAPYFFNIPPEVAADARLVLLIGGLTVASTLVGSVHCGIITGLQRFDISSGLEILLTTVRTIGVVVALKQGYDLVALALIHLLTSMVHGLLAYRIVRRIYPEMKLRFDQPLRPHMRTILSFSMFLSIIHVLTMIIYYTDTIVIAVVLPISAVAVFAIAANLCDYASKVAGALTKAITPRVSALKSVGARDVGDEVLAAARLTTLCMTPIAITFALRGDTFIGLWMGEEFAKPSGQVLQVLAIMVWLGGARWIAGSAIIGSGHHRWLIPAYVLEAICNLGLSIWLAHRIGLVGVAWGTVIPGVLISLFWVPVLLRRSIGVKLHSFYVRAWVLPTLACVPFGIATWAVQRYLDAERMLVFFGQVFMILPLVVAAALLLCTTADERQALGALARRVFSRGQGTPRVPRQKSTP